MATAREVLNNQLAALNADLANNPAATDPRIQTKADLEIAIADATAWYDVDLDAIKAFIAKYL